MAIIRWLKDEEPWSVFEKMQREMERWMSPIRPLLAFQSNVYPPMNVYDDGESFIVRAEIPGVDPKNIDVSVVGDTLTIKGKREETTEKEDECYHRRESNHGEFRRAFTLPDQVDVNKVLANTKDGVLEVRLPRAESAKVRRIDVKTN